jgi:hypothetical protein
MSSMLQSESGRARLLDFQRLAAVRKQATEKDCHSNSANPTPAISANAKEVSVSNNNNVTVSHDNDTAASKQQPD